MKHFDTIVLNVQLVWDPIQNACFTWYVETFFQTHDAVGQQLVGL